MAKYSLKFNNDFNWYLSVRHIFNFDGQLDKHDVLFDITGVDARRAFLLLDAQGRLVPTRHPNILRSLLKIKGSVNLHAKMYAESRADGTLPKVEFDKICQQYAVPDWFIDAVEKQKTKYY